MQNAEKRYRSVRRKRMGFPRHGVANRKGGGGGGGHHLLDERGRRENTSGVLSIEKKKQSRAKEKG